MSQHAILTARAPGCDALVRISVSSPDHLARETARIRKSGMTVTRIDDRHVTVFVAPDRARTRTCAPVMEA